MGSQPLTPKKPHPAQPQSPSLSEAKLQLARKSVSPHKRTSEWLKLYSPEVKTPKVLTAKSRKVSKPSDAVKQSRAAVERKSKLWSHVLPRFLLNQLDNENQGDLEGDTLLGETQTSTSLKSDNDDTLLKDAADAEIESAKPFILKPTEDTLYTPTAEDLRVISTWSRDEAWLFLKINSRGFEPLLPETWAHQFVLLPEQMFSEDDSEVTIKTYKGNDYNGK